MLSFITKDERNCKVVCPVGGGARTEVPLNPNYMDLWSETNIWYKLAAVLVYTF
jgi:hypothetical protein